MNAFPPAPITAPITCLSSMATRQVLAELAMAFERRTGTAVVVASVGGVEAARRVQAGERFDLVVLAGDAIGRLIAGGHLLAGSRVDLVRSPVAVAVRRGAPLPDISSEYALRTALLAARSIGFSTGPSGTYLVKLFERWGIAAQMHGRIVQAPPGVPVGALLARGEVELGFQQLSELMHLDGVDVVGLLPGDTAFITTFSAARCPGPAHADTLALLSFMTSPDSAASKRRHGMEPA